MPARRRLQQDVERIADQAPRAEHDQAADQERGDGVGLARAAGRDHDAGDQRAERAERVGGRVAQDALEVEVLAVAAREHERGDAVADQAEGADGRDPGAVDIGRVGQAPDRLDEHPRPRPRRAATPFANAAKISARPKPNVRRPRAGREAAHAAAMPERDRPDVRQHVPGVREQRDRVEQQPAGDRGREHRHVDGERDRHPAGVAGARMVVSVMRVHAVSLAHCLR